MSKSKLENISMRISSETKEYFEDLFQESGSNSKGEFLKILMDKYSSLDEEINKISEINKQKYESIYESKAAENTLKENQIVISLNELQFSLIEFLTTKHQCRKSLNSDIEDVNNGIDRSFWGNKLYSGYFKDLFSNYNCEDSPEKIKEDMGTHLLNTFMLSIARGAYVEIGLNANYINWLRNQIENPEN